MVCLFPFSKFLDALRGFTCPRVIVNLGSIYLGVIILSHSLFVAFMRNISVLKELRVYEPSRPL